MLNSLISVSNKSGLSKLSRFFMKKNIDMYCSGGTYDFLREPYKLLNVGCKVTRHIKSIENITHFPEILEGRVKTLNPYVFSGLLGDLDNAEHVYDLETYKMKMIDYLIVNLYPFEDVVSNDPGIHSKIIENIDIGGHAMLRAASKNYKQVLPICDPMDYDYIMDNWEDANTLEYRKFMADKTFKYVTQYDKHISEYFSGSTINKNNPIQNDKNTIYLNGNSLNDNLIDGNPLEGYKHKSNYCVLKYGMNPHQYSRVIQPSNKILEVENGNPGYINYLDAIHGWKLISQMSNVLNGFFLTTSVKHNTPTGLGLSSQNVWLDDFNTLELNNIYYGKIPKVLADLSTDELTNCAKSFINARYTDPLSSFGDCLVFNSKIDKLTAQLIKGEVSDCIVAPDYTEEALEILKKKKKGNYNIFRIHPKEMEYYVMENKNIGGIQLEQHTNNTIYNIQDKLSYKIESDFIYSMEIGFNSLAYIQSNSVIFLYKRNIVGIGAGQQNRVDAIRIAGEKARLNLLRKHPKCIHMLDGFKPEISITKRISAINMFIQNNFYTDEIYQKWLELFIPDFEFEFLDKDEIMEFMEAYPLTMASDGFLPFEDNIYEADRYGVKYIIQPGGSIADDSNIQLCDELGIKMVMTGQRMFYH